MLDSIFSATQDVASRAQLHKLLRLASNEDIPPKASRFRVHGWRWHHLGVVRDLTRLHETAVARSSHLCDVSNPQSRVSRQQLLEFLKYIVHDNWQLHNHVEKTLFLPWIRTRDDDVLHARRTAIVAHERERLSSNSALLKRHVHKWVHCSPTQCDKELHVILSRIDRLKYNAASLFKASEAVFIPRVMALFSDEEQLRFNSTVLKNISGRQARTSLVIFHDAIQQSDPIIADGDDRTDFENAVPAAVRKLALPYWRGKFVHRKARFLTDPDR